MTDMGEGAGLMSVPRQRAGNWNRTTGHVVIDGLQVAFGSGSERRLAIADVSLDIPPGRFVCLLGPSGCGKSTVLNTIAGFVPPSAGSVTVDGEPVTAPGADRGMVFQQPALFPWKTTLNNVAFGPLMAGHGAAAAESTARTLLAMVGLSRFADHYPEQLSGGMQQRVGIARALANYPRVLLMDEPFGALDAQTRTMMQEALLGVWSEFRTTVVFVTHDIDEAIYLGDTVAVMGAHPGRIVEELNVPLPRPRTAESAFDPEFIRLKRHCLELIRGETLRSFSA
ncbi:MAG TPA: ABC transporter ATP-binding protein [Acetobacteraceae bacterium]|jgi:NitT/TauT family transport system ATP-binding protein